VYNCYGNYMLAIIFELGSKVSKIVTTETCGEVSVMSSMKFCFCVCTTVQNCVNRMLII